MVTSGTTETIARWVGDCQYGRLPGDVLRQAKECILDTIGVTLAGTVTDAGRVTYEYVRSRNRRPIAGAVGFACRLEPSLAALLNGVCGHALDLDDTNFSLIGHASVVVLPAVLAAAEEAGATGKDLLAAFVAGTEVACKLGAALNPCCYETGWHSTGSVGVFGAAAGCAHIWGLSEEQTRSALGLAGAQAAGIRCNNGTMAKPYQAGHAAEAGLVAADLARCGMTASGTILEGADGYFRVYNRDAVDLTPFRRLGDPYDLIDPGVTVKRYPSCSSTAPALDALFALLAEHPVPWQEVAVVDCQVTSLVYESLRYHAPVTGLQGKFSLQFCLAAALLHGRVDIDTFTDEVARDPRIRELMARISMAKDPAADGFVPSIAAAEAATVTLRTRDGQSFREQREYPVGSPQCPMSAEELRAKFRRCAGVRLKDAAVEELLAHVDALDELNDLQPLIRLCNHPDFLQETN